MTKDFVKRQQEIIDQDIRDMPPEEINAFLEELSPEAANAVLEKIGHRRARDIYDSHKEKGCLEIALLLAFIVLCSWDFFVVLYWLSSWW